jgi:hypothetical protein
MEKEAKDYNVMSASIGLDQIEEIFSCEVSDEALEAAAGIGNKIAGQYTLFFTALL